MSKQKSDQESKIKSLSEDIQLFAHLASHDLKDPLRQAVANLEEGNGGGDTKELINNVIDKISYLREYSHIVNFKGDVEKVNCNEIMQECMSQLSEYLEKNNAKIIYNDLPEINAVPSNIKTAFLALITNAINFNMNSEKTLDISCLKEDDYWKFKFSDNGIGIDQVYRKLIFALFQTIEPESKLSGNGTGLAFCKKIVENHDGKIWFETNEQNGTDFYFTIAA